MRKRYFSPEFELTRIDFERLLNDDPQGRPSDNHTPIEDGDDGLD